MKKVYSVFIIIGALFFTGCGQEAIPPTPTNTATQPPTLVPTATSTSIPTFAPTSPPSQEDLKNEWGPAILGGHVSQMVCNIMLETTTKYQSYIRSQSIIGWVYIYPLYELFEEWEPSGVVAPYAESIEADRGVLMEILFRWIGDMKVDPNNDFDIITKTCDSLLNTNKSMKMSALTAGMTPATLDEIYFDESRNYAQEVDDTFPEKYPTYPRGLGIYTVGDEIAAGKWESAGSEDGCYWARYDDQQETLDSHNGLAGGTMTIRPDDYEVEIYGCGTWEYVEGKQREPMDNIAAPKEDGFYTVGVEIAAGKWKSTGSGPGCYWARLDGNQDILDFHFGLAGGTVTIQPGDYEVEFNNCGIWEYVTLHQKLDFYLKLLYSHHNLNG